MFRQDTGVRAAILISAVLAGCGGIPRDPEGTLERVRRDHLIRVGLVTGAGQQGGDRWRDLLAGLSRATGARPAIRQDALEPLLLRLEAGDLDLVVGGRFAEDTPWKTRVALGPVLDHRPVAQGAPTEHAAARNGENAWVILIQRQAKALDARD